MRSICSILLFILLLCVIAPVHPVLSIPWFEPDVNVRPPHPWTNESVTVEVCFFMPSFPPYVQSFGSLVETETGFAIEVTIYVPAPEECVTQIIHDDTYSYDLGLLDARTYEFQVWVTHVHYTEGFRYLSRSVSFSVDPPPPPLLSAAVTFDPCLLNPKARNELITANIELLDRSYSPRYIVHSTIRLNTMVEIEPNTTVVGMFDGDAWLDLQVKFDRDKILGFIFNEFGRQVGLVNVTLVLSGDFNDGYYCMFMNNVTITISTPWPDGLHAFILPS